MTPGVAYTPNLTPSLPRICAARRGTSVPCVAVKKSTNSAVFMSPLELDALGPLGDEVALAGDEAAVLVEVLLDRGPVLDLAAVCHEVAAHLAHEVDGRRRRAVEVAAEEGVGAAQLAGPALQAVGDVSPCSVELANARLTMPRSDGVEAVGRVGLVAIVLVDRADLAAELVAAGEDRVAVLDERTGMASVPVERLLVEGLGSSAAGSCWAPPVVVGLVQVVLAGVHDVVRVEHLLDLLHEVELARP